MLGGLEDVDIEDWSSSPGADIFCDNDVNDVSDIFWMWNVFANLHTGIVYWRDQQQLGSWGGRWGVINANPSQSKNTSTHQSRNRAHLQKPLKRQKPASLRKKWHNQLHWTAAWDQSQLKCHISWRPLGVHCSCQPWTIVWVAPQSLSLILPRVSKWKPSFKSQLTLCGQVQNKIQWLDAPCCKVNDLCILSSPPCWTQCQPQAVDHLNEKQTWFGSKALKFVNCFFQGPEYINNPNKIMQYALWVTQGDGSALYSKPTQCLALLKQRIQVTL